MAGAPASALRDKQHPPDRASVFRTGSRILDTAASAAVEPVIARWALARGTGRGAVEAPGELTARLM
jgi:hypothetical protein